MSLSPSPPAPTAACPPACLHSEGGNPRCVRLCVHQHPLIIALLCRAIRLFKIIALVTSDILYQRKPDKHTRILVQASVYLLHICGWTFFYFFFKCTHTSWRSWWCCFFLCDKTLNEFRQPSCQHIQYMKQTVLKVAKGINVFRHPGFRLNNHDSCLNKKVGILHHGLGEKSWCFYLNGAIRHFLSLHSPDRNIDCCFAHKHI